MEEIGWECASGELKKSPGNYRLTLGAKANPGRLLARINHTFLKKLFFTECTEIRTEVTEPNTLSAL